MTKICTSVQELLAATGGETSELSAGERAHLDNCAACSAAREREVRLARLLETALPPEDASFQEAVMSALAPRRRRRRALALLPAAAALLLTLAGTVLLGGVPAGGLFAQVPAWSSHGWVALAATAHDWMIAVNATCRAMALLPPLVPIAAVAVSLAGLLALLGAARRWRAVHHSGRR